MRTAPSQERLQPANTVVRQGKAGPKYYRTELFSVTPEEAGPQAHLGDHPADSVIRPHFHTVEQFQVYVRGDAMLGKKAVSPTTVQYTDGFTPYGPIVAGPDGVAFLTLRPRYDAGARYMPESRDKLEQKARRNLVWSKRVDSIETMMLGPTSRIDMIFDSQPDGLAAWLLRTGPGTEVPSPPPAAAGGGQYWIPMTGSVWSEGHELAPWSCLFVDGSGPDPVLTTGSAGTDVLVLQFPVDTRSRSDQPAEAGA
jgi:hypothetical protein